ncbi:hypothetical protein [Pseudoduganella chitinolytica]|uniref:Uncharacterized protein n=1 Tax=Pseudoduganella chitinolytica TaxID=34070 RepID=A0ABY8BG80_9BURK|nr:hypothetical protein [Pseudoduganella chitinolytica]WEF34917.1 hypothetical protein PX653_09195 [Pseudoduganella chitinolytica]
MDMLTAGEIDRAIEIDRMEGAIRAWLYLAQRGVSPDTIRCILSLDGTAVAARRAFRKPDAGPDPVHH